MSTSAHSNVANTNKYKVTNIREYAHSIIENKTNLNRLQYQNQESTVNLKEARNQESTAVLPGFYFYIVLLALWFGELFPLICTILMYVKTIVPKS